MLVRGMATVVMVAGLAWPVGAWSAEPTPAAPTPAVVPEKTPDVAPAPAPKRVPDGVFVGSFALEDGQAEVRLVVAAGVLVDGAMQLPGGGEPMPLVASGAVESATLRAGGERGTDYVRLTVEFFDVDRGTGTFEGVLARHRVSGSWAVERR
ncbi:MAG: hypothetical protein EP329_09575 [Deltaproteobacteria bacterium]|nr:MAG: hypothetical protein EP329_09575 [Deltaproteobacteria bacterium]